MLGMRQKYAGYKSYVEAGNNEDISQFYNRGNAISVIGNQNFREHIAEHKDELKISAELPKLLNERPTANAIIKAVSRVTQVSESTIKHQQKARRIRNDARKLAIYLSQQIGDLSLADISKAFQISEAGVSFVVSDMKKLFEQDVKWQRQKDKVLKELNYIQ